MDTKEELNVIVTTRYCTTEENNNYLKTSQVGDQPSQNVLAAGHLAAYNEISAAYFTLVRLVLKTRLPLLPITIASLPTTRKHFDWAG